MPLSGNAGVTPITVGQTISGALTTLTLRRSVDCAICYADLYEFTLTAPRNLVITMNSTALDSFLNLLNVNGEILAADDDSGGARNARIAGAFAAGTFRIGASTSIPETTGSYTITLARLP